jgi:hypothetical protein
MAASRERYEEEEDEVKEILSFSYHNKTNLLSKFQEFLIENDITDYNTSIRVVRVIKDEERYMTVDEFYQTYGDDSPAKKRRKKEDKKSKKDRKEKNDKKDKKSKKDKQDAKDKKEKKEKTMEEDEAEEEDEMNEDKGENEDDDGIDYDTKSLQPSDSDSEVLPIFEVNYYSDIFQPSDSDSEVLPIFKVYEEVHSSSSSSSSILPWDDDSFIELKEPPTCSSLKKKRIW